MTSSHFNSDQLIYVHYYFCNQLHTIRAGNFTLTPQQPGWFFFLTLKKISKILQSQPSLMQYYCGHTDVSIHLYVFCWYSSGSPLLTWCRYCFFLCFTPTSFLLYACPIKSHATNSRVLLSGMYQYMSHCMSGLYKSDSAGGDSSVDIDSPRIIHLPQLCSVIDPHWVLVIYVYNNLINAIFVPKIYWNICNICPPQIWRFLFTLSTGIITLICKFFSTQSDKKEGSESKALRNPNKPGTQ